MKLTLPFKNPFLLAPMEEVNDIAFRLLCKKAGCGMTWTGMIHPQTHQQINLQDNPVLQLFTTTTKGIKDFIKKYDSKVAGWDFNLGCPAKTAKKHGFGSFLTHDLETVESILRIMRKSTKNPLFVKIRKSKNAFKILKIAEKYCDAIILHPRTQTQGYSGKADLDYALRFKNKSKIPVIYSGDVDETNYKQLLKEFDYLMIGRRCLGDPNIFSKLQGNSKKQPTFKDYLKLAKEYSLPFRQLKFQAMNFTKRHKGAKQLRLKIFKIKTKKELQEFMDQEFLLLS